MSPGCYVSVSDTEAAMKKHMHTRMNQRGIRKNLADFARHHGKIDGDKFRLDRSGAEALIAELDAMKRLALRIRDKGGLVVVEAGGEYITAYRCER